MTSTASDQAMRAEHFRALHVAEEILVLPNAWDAASARIFQATGARAIGTTSMGIAASAGYPDVQQIPLDAMVQRVGEIARAVDLPVSADMEAGYGLTNAQVVRSIRLAVAHGAVGINLEDGTGDPERPLVDTAVHADRIAAIRDAERADGMPLVINARTDVLFAGPGDVAERVAEAVVRGNAYRAAGADCVFVPGADDADTIETLVKAIDAPLNVLANPALMSVAGMPTIRELQALGVARVSVGSGPMRAALAYLRRLADELIHAGTYDVMRAELEHPMAREAYESAIRGAP